MAILLFAGAEGIEPALAVLETAVLPFNDAPFHILTSLRIVGRKKFRKTNVLKNSLLTCNFYFLVCGALAAPSAILLQFHFALYLTLVLAGIVIAPFTSGTL